jgi:hypothetical protein
VVAFSFGREAYKDALSPHFSLVSTGSAHAWRARFRNGEKIPRKLARPFLRVSTMDFPSFSITSSISHFSIFVFLFRNSDNNLVNI